MNVSNDFFFEIWTIRFNCPCMKNLFDNFDHWDKPFSLDRLKEGSKGFYPKHMHLIC